MYTSLAAGHYYWVSHNHQITNNLCLKYLLHSSCTSTCIIPTYPGMPCDQSYYTTTHYYCLYLQVNATSIDLTCTSPSLHNSSINVKAMLECVYGNSRYVTSWYKLRFAYLGIAEQFQFQPYIFSVLVSLSCNLDLSSYYVYSCILLIMSRWMHLRYITQIIMTHDPLCSQITTLSTETVLHVHIGILWPAFLTSPPV
jgi:hypothetical protein